MTRRWVIWGVVAGCVTVGGLSCSPTSSPDQPAGTPQAPAQTAAPAEPCSPSEPSVPPKTETPAVAPKAETPAPPRIETPAAPKEPNSPVPPPAPKVPEVNDSTVVGKVGDYRVCAGELKKRFLQEMAPNPYSTMPRMTHPELIEVLRTMLGEKAMVLEGRAKGYADQDRLPFRERQTKDRLLALAVVSAALEGKVIATEEEIQQEIKANPKLSTEQATNQVKAKKGAALFDPFYAEVCQGVNLKKASEQIPTVLAIYERLLERPKVARPPGLLWITSRQIQDEIDPNEKSIVLATFDGGRLTVKDWFDALNEISPPGRRDIGTLQGVAAFLDRCLMSPVLAAEARRRGLDKAPEYVAKARDVDDTYLKGLMDDEVWKTVRGEPNDQDVALFVERNKHRFSTNASIKAEVIWCMDRPAADRIRDEADSGKDCAALRKEYSLFDANEPVELFATSEGPFWPDLWNTEPNQIVGPVLGLRGMGLHWRVVKVLDKRPGRPFELNDQTRDTVKSNLMEQRAAEAMRKTQGLLLDKYSAEVYTQYLPAVDPLKVP